MKRANQRIIFPSLLKHTQCPVPMVTPLSRRSSIRVTPTHVPATTYARSTERAAWINSTVSHISACQVGPATARSAALQSSLQSLRSVCALSGCKLGEASEFLVQQDSRIQVPTRAGCYEVCNCGPSGRLENCVEMPCVDANKPCIVEGQRKSKTCFLSIQIVCTSL